MLWAVINCCIVVGRSEYFDLYHRSVRATFFDPVLAHALLGPLSCLFSVADFLYFGTIQTADRGAKWNLILWVHNYSAK